ncbi:hypothetical protein PC112_g21321, partial [Phytophthora cactorum]
QVIDRYVSPIEASGAVIVVKFEDGSVAERGVPSDVNQDAPDVRLLSPGQGQRFDVDDLTQLIELDETTILSALETRFAEHKIYTNTGAILLAVNPFQKISNVYSKDTLAKYLLSFESRSSSMRSNPMPPHIYQVAGEAYKAMMLGLNGVMSDQSILVSGESGSGKTESTKFLMEYLAQAGANNLAASVAGKSPEGIAAKVLQTNILLESFGNARTLRNDNSSRFGKFIKLHFTSGGRLTGASIQTYLLEKVRLVSQSKGERNYHIFYEMAIGAAPAARKRWFLDPPKGHMMPPGDHGEVTDATRQFLHYRYLNQSECYQRRDGVKDSDMFRRVMDAMDIVGFTQAERAGIFDILAALMHIGNLSFEHDENSDRLGQSMGPGAGKSDLAPSCIWSRDAAATLMAVDATKLERALSVRRIRAGTDFVSMKLSAAQANNARDALAKALYGRLFDWMAVRVARAGYPIRLPHDVFVARYFSLKRSKNPLLAKKQGTSFGLPDTDSDEGMAVISSEAKELLKELLDVIPKENDANPQGACERPDQGQFATKCISVGIQMGFTKMFMKKPTYEFLEEMRSQRLHRHMIKIFYAVLCVTARARYLRYLHAVKTLQIRFRYKKLQKLRRRRLVMMIRKRNAGKVQGFIRTVVQRRKFVRFLAVVRMLQCRFKFRRRMRAKRTEADRARKLANLKREQQLQAVTQYTESSTASSDSSPRSVTSHSNDIEGSGFSDASSDYSDDMFTYNDNFPKHNLNTVDEQSSQLMPRASHRVSLRKSQSIDSITPMGGFRASQMHNTHGSQGQMVHTPGSRSRLPSRKSSFRNTRSSRAVALPRLDVIQHTSWVNDEDRFSCHICNKRFNVFKRKHHCRACGEVICNSCSLYHRIQSRSMRVCVSCVAFHSLDSPTSAGSTGFLRPGGGSAHSSNSSRKTSNGSAPDRNRSSTLSSGMWLNPWPEPPYPVDEEERLTVLRELNIRELGLSGKFNMYCEVAAKTMKCPIAYVSIIEDEEQLLVANIGMAHTTLPRELSFCAHTICQPSVLVVLDTKNDERFRENPMVKGDKGAVKIRYYAGATIFSRDGHALGTVAVLDTKPRREADQEHIGMLQHLSFLASEKMTQSTIHEDTGSDSEFL